MTIECLVLSSALFGLLVAKIGLIAAETAPAIRARRNRQISGWAGAAAQR